MKKLHYLSVVLLIVGMMSCNKDGFEKQSIESNISHMGFDFSANSETGTVDGEIIGWYPGGGSNPDYASGLWYRNDQGGLSNEQKHYGEVDPDDITSAPSTWDATLTPMLINHVYVFKCIDGFALVKVTSMPTESSDPSDWTVGVQYLFSETGEF